MGRHGGGAFSGKDPSKVDRSAAYASRWAAKHVVASGIAEKCEIQLAYAIGVAEPVSVFVNTMGTGSVEDDIISPRGPIYSTSGHRRSSRNSPYDTPIYSSSASGGHFGRNPDSEGRFSWESLDHEILESLKG